LLGSITCNDLLQGPQRPQVIWHQKVLQHHQALHLLINVIQNLHLLALQVVQTGNSHSLSSDKGDKKLVFSVASVDALQGSTGHTGHSTAAVIDRASMPVYCLIAGTIKCSCLLTACHMYHTDHGTHSLLPFSGRAAPEMCSLPFTLLSNLGHVLCNGKLKCLRR